jgi:hypothetical protein
MITPEMVELWRRIEEVEAEDSHKAWEPEGRKREWYDASGKLHCMLGLRPWETGPNRVTGPETPDYMQHNPLQLEGWRKAWELRQALEGATGREC